jgi:acyl-coenzyme A synthetase/AMP-(fatty) acid ligase
MSKIYEYLKEKANDPNYQDKIYFFHNHYGEYGYANYLITFKLFYENVNEYIKLFKNNGYTRLVGKPCFLVVNRSISNAATFIALLELGIKPIPVFSNTLHNELKLQEIKNNNNNNLLDIIPQITKDNDKLILIDEYELSSDTLIFDNNKTIKCNSKDISNIISNIIDINQIKDNNFDFALLTSGTTGNNKVFKINESDLINAINKKYDLSKEETFICQSPISSISGMLFDIYLPIIGKNKAISNGMFYEHIKEAYNYINMILPGNFTESSNTYLYFHNLHHVNYNQITLLGCNPSHIYDLKELKKRTNCKIVNFYGRTENYGLISHAEINVENEIYIYYPEIYTNKITYKHNGITYELVYENNSLINRQIEDYSESGYADYLYVLPIAEANNLNENIRIDGEIFGEIIGDGLKTGDYGFKLNDKIYYVGRSSDFIKTENNGFYYITTLESNITNHLSKYPFYDEDWDENAIKMVQGYIVNKDNSLVLYLSCDYIKSYFDNNFRTNAKFCEDIYVYLNKYKINFSDIILCKDETVQNIFENSKVKRHKLLNFRSICNFMDIHNHDDVTNMIIKVLEEKLKISSSISYDTWGKYYVFSKKEFSVNNIAKVLTYFNVLEFREDDNNYYLAISDDFLFGNYEYQENINLISKIEDLINKKQIREYLLEKNNLLRAVPLKINYTTDADGVITAKINRLYLLPEIIESKEKIHNIISNDNEIEYVTNVSLYDLHKLKLNENKRYVDFKIDQNNNLYVNDILIKFDHRTPIIYNQIYKLLLEHKKTKDKIMAKKR